MPPRCMRRPTATAENTPAEPAASDAERLRRPPGAFSLAETSAGLRGRCLPILCGARAGAPACEEQNRKKSKRVCVCVPMLGSTAARRGLGSARPLRVRVLRPGGRQRWRRRPRGGRGREGETCVCVCVLGWGWRWTACAGWCRGVVCLVARTRRGWPLTGASLRTTRSLCGPAPPPRA